MTEERFSESKLSVSAWPMASGNPYIADLYQRIQQFDSSVSVHGFTVAGAWRTEPDLIHIHWPESASAGSSLAKAATKTAIVLGTLRLLKKKGAKIVWTCHNLHSHDLPYPRLESFFRRHFDQMVDGVIHLTEESQTLLADHPVLGRVTSAVVPHGRFSELGVEQLDKATARLRLGLDPDRPVIGFVGRIRPYKNVPRLIEAFGQMSTPATLLIGGNPLNDDIRESLRSAAAPIDNVRLDDRWLADDELATRVLASDVIVLPYREVHNSGVAILAVGLERPVVINPQGSMAGFQQAVGSDWVYTLDEPLHGPHLDDITRWALKPRTMGPDVSSFDPALAAERTITFFRQVVSAKATESTASTTSSRTDVG